MNHDRQNGFTLIELMLAMTFIAVLLVAIAMTTIQISNIYSKGITLREVDQTGRAVTDDLQRSIASATPFDVTPKTDGSLATASSHYITWEGGGRLCLGNYSYVWNYGKALLGGTGAPQIFNKYSDSSTPIRFAKVSDPSGGLCAIPPTNVIPDVLHANATEMLTGGDRDLVIHSFTITRTANDPTTSQSIYALTMLIGTNDQNQLTANDASCKPPSDGVGDETYCSVNQFDIIARAGNTSGGE